MIWRAMLVFERRGDVSSEYDTIVAVLNFYLKWILPLGEHYEYHLVSSLYGQVAKLIEYIIEVI